VPLTYATLEHHQNPHVFVVARLMPFVQKTIVSTNYHNTCLVISTCYGACYNQ
jgi:molybdopterin-guanine dinucleotide biosynthesis protein A